MSAAAMAFCVLAAGTAFLRAEMLRHRLDPRRGNKNGAEASTDAPARPTYAGNYLMIVGLDLAAIGFVGMLISIHVRNYQPSPELLFLLGTCSLSSAITLGSMIGHNWREFIRAISDDACEEVARTLPDALEAGVHAFIHRDVLYEPEPPHRVPHQKKAQPH